MPCPASWIHQNRKLPTDEMQWFTLRCKIRERACPGWVKSPPADDVVYTAEDPQKADRIAAAPRTGGQCRFCCKSRRGDWRDLPQRAFSNVGAVRSCRSLQLERRPDALVPTPATQLQRYLTLTQHTRRQRAAVVLPALQGGAGSVR